MNNSVEAAPLNELQRVIIETLQVFHDFCKEHELSYHLGGGTLLGAVRHKGIIPWDDDIDIDMPRDDYERLLTLVDRFPSPYMIKHFRVDKNYVYPFIKIYDPRMQVTEFFGDKGYTSGAWIDVFPMDGVFSNMSLRKSHFFLAKIFYACWRQKVMGFHLSRAQSITAAYAVKSGLKLVAYLGLSCFPRGWVFAAMDGFARIKSYKKSPYIGSFYSPYGVKASFPKAIYKETIPAEFNGHFFDMPSGYDVFLTMQYGDYMTPPPVHERRSHHTKIG